MDLPDPALILLVGPSGSGKSTWAERRYLPEEIVSSDRLRAMVGSGETDLDASSDAFDLLRTITAARSSRGLTVVVDTVGLDEDLRRWALDLARAHGLTAIAVVFSTPLAVCKERNRGRVRPVPMKVLEGQHRRTREVNGLLSAEGWVVRIVMEGSERSEQPSTFHGVGTSPSKAALEFVLHLSRFDPEQEIGPWLTAVARTAESAGFAGVSVMDHLVQIPQVGRPWEDMPEALTTLGFLLGVTDSIRVGPLVLNTTLRSPALVAKALASLDSVSGGRMFCGIGAGWWQTEERSYGYPALTTAERLDRLEDAARLLPLMWGKGSTSYEGPTIRVEDAMSYPRPSHEIELIVGGGGERRTLRIAARYADSVNLVGGIDVVRRKLPVLGRHCDDVGRDPADVAVTVLDVALLGQDRRAVNDLVERHRGRSSASAFRARVGAGTTEQLAVRYLDLSDAGVSTVFVTMPNLVGPADVESFGTVIAACLE